MELYFLHEKANNLIYTLEKTNVVNLASTLKYAKL